MLEVSDLEVYYGLSHILFGVTLRAAAGEAVALLGRNGAGKSTTLKAIMGLVPPSAGRVLFRGEDLVGKPPHLICRKGIGFVPEDRRIFPDLTVRENLEVGRRPEGNGDPMGSVERVFGLFPALRDLAERAGDSLSGGEQQMLAIARTLVGDPALLLLDEPSEGLAPRVLQDLAGHVQRLKREGMTILLSEQNLHFATRVSDRAYILEKGRIQYEGAIEELRADAEVRRRYLMV
ncbi:MAG: ABC transporter ATP-binding protein [Candidatus Methylomirabilota bacterium]|jgi:branched-chain amino acid transport system ATP-binding protein